MKFLINAPKRAKKRRSARKRKSTAARRVKRRITRKRTGRGRITQQEKPKMKRRKKGGATKRRAARRFRRNPGAGFRASGIMGRVKVAAMDAGGILAGEAISGALPRLVGLSGEGMVGVAARLAAGIVGASLVGRMVSPRFADAMLAGSIAREARAFVKGANVPVISAALGDADNDSASFFDSLGDADTGIVMPGESYGGIAGYSSEGVAGYLGGYDEGLGITAEELSY